MPLTRSKESGKNEKDDEDLSFENEDEDGVVKKKSKNTAINRPKSIAEVKKGRESTAGKMEASRRIDREHGSDREAEVSNWKKKDKERKQPVRKKLEEDKKMKKFKQRPATEKERSNPQTKKSKKLQIEAKSVSMFRPPSTHLFSKGPHNQKDVLPSIIRAKVSKSVGLIHIDGNATGTGFRVGEKYIVTCKHVIQSAIKAKPDIIDSKLVSIEFERTKYNKKEDPLRIFDLIDIAYLDEEHDFAVLELGTHNSSVPFPPALTCFGEVICSDVYLVGHPGCRQMMEDSVIPYWLPEHNNRILPEIKRLGRWSQNFFPDKKDYYKELKTLPRKIMFHSTFDHGSSGSPGVLIKDEQPCVVLMVRGGVPTCVYDNTFPTLTPSVEDDKKVEYGYAMEDIYKKMRNSSREKSRNLASEIFKTWKC